MLKFKLNKQKKMPRHFFQTLDKSEFNFFESCRSAFSSETSGLYRESKALFRDVYTAEQLFARKSSSQDDLYAWVLEVHLQNKLN